MLNTLSLNPMVLVHFAAICQTVIVAGYAAVPERFEPGEFGKKNTLAFFRGLGSGSLIIMGILFLDTSLLWLFGNWSTSDWQYQLPNVIILLILGLEYILVPLFKKGSIIKIVFTGVAATILLVFHHVVISPLDVMGELLEAYLPIIIFGLIGIYAFIELIEVLVSMKKVKSGKIDGSKPHWDFGKKLRIVFNRYLNIVIWILCIVQSIGAFLGFSILTFWY